MHPPAIDTELDYFVEAFESAHQRCVTGVSPVELDRFLPAPAHPLYARVLRELVCVDLDYGWGRGTPTPLTEYRRRFPALFADPDGVRAIVWEEYRQRRQAGQEPDAEDYRARFGVSLPGNGADADDVRTEAVAVTPVGAWADRLDTFGTGPRATPGAADLYREACRSDPAAAERYARAMTALPTVGDTVDGFRLEAELGRGAFGRVFLARQLNLAGRPVALKVSTELFDEAQTLAQLQHTNIVPIYSRHQVGAVQAVCMPYFGGTTLADVFRALTGKALPASGKHFVSTLHGRKQSTVRSALSHPFPGFAGEGPGVRVLDFTQQPPSPPAPLPQSRERGEEIVPTTEALAALEHLSYPEAVLWLGAKLADGLAHAHAKGIVHRDLKPANILLTDDGQPMLLDFNLSDNAALRGTEAGAWVGGTLPYTSPEQLRAFRQPGPRRIDGRSDIYSLGLILFELLTGRMAFPPPCPPPSAGGELGRGGGPTGPVLAERSGPPPRLRAVNRAVSPAVEAIVRRCLEPDPDRRYQSARDLQDDIERHLHDLPLKHTPEPSARERLAKWGRRHPRLTSGTSVAVLATAVLVAVGAAAWGLRREVRRRDAADGLRELLVQSDKILPRLIRSLDAEGREAAAVTARDAVAKYGVFDRPDWQAGPLVTALPAAEQDRLRGRIGEVLFLLARSAADNPDQAQSALQFNDLAAACFPGADRPRAWWEQRAVLLKKLGDGVAADAATEQARKVELRTVQDHYLAALKLYEDGRYRDAVPLLRRATADDPKHFWAWSLLGNCHYFLGQDGDAAKCYSVCISLDPTQARPYFNRARVMVRTRDFRQAVTDLGRAAANDPDDLDTRIEAAMNRHRQAVLLSYRPNPNTALEEMKARGGRQLTVEQRQLLREAEAGLTEILGRPDAPTRCSFYRAVVRQTLGDKAGSEADRAAGFAREPAATDDRSWIARGLSRLQAGQPELALADFRKAEQINPGSVSALQNQANVLTNASRPQEALAALDKLLDRYPDTADARAGRAVVLARLGRTQEAIADAEWIKKNSANPLMTYQIAGVYALTADRPGHAREALRLLAQALLQGEGYQYLQTDPELKPLRDRPEFGQLVAAVRTLQDFLKPDATAPEKSKP